MSLQLPNDYYDLIKVDTPDSLIPYLESLDYTSANIDFLSKSFMYAVEQQSLRSAQLFAEFGANVNGYGDFAKYYNMRNRLPGIEDIIYTPIPQPKKDC